MTLNMLTSPGLSLASTIAVPSSPRKCSVAWQWLWLEPVAPSVRNSLASCNRLPCYCVYRLLDLCFGTFYQDRCACNSSQYTRFCISSRSLRGTSAKSTPLAVTGCSSPGRPSLRTDPSYVQPDRGSDDHRLDLHSIILASHICFNECQWALICHRTHGAHNLLAVVGEHPTQLQPHR
jgi:hypothetical protein